MEEHEVHHFGRSGAILQQEIFSIVCPLHLFKEYWGVAISSLSPHGPNVHVDSCKITTVLSSICVIMK